MTSRNPSLPLPFPAQDLFARAAQAGLTRLDEFQVLGALVARASDGGQPCVEACRQTLAQTLGLPLNRVGRILVILRDLGLILRKQWRRAKGEVAVTVVTEAAMVLFGRTGGVALPDTLPPALATELGVQDPAFVASFTAAWEAGNPAAADWDTFFGAVSAREALERALAHEATLRQHEVQSAPARTLESVSLADGVLEMDVDLLSLGLGHAVDGKWVAAALEECHVWMPLTIETASRLVPELAWSRSVGFASRIGWTGAVRAVASLVRNGRWSRPKGLHEGAYRRANPALRVANDLRLQRAFA